MSTVDAVRSLYDRWPYPARDPTDERLRLIWTPLDFLAGVNDRCFGGRQSFGAGTRVLVAGCGTGDSAIYLAEQLRHCDAEVVALDLSASALDVARARAEVRGLSNIAWHHASLLELPAMSLGRFDYVNCGGVLHHLDDPDAGLRALMTTLGPEGVLGLMVYGRYGRAGIDTVRALLAGVLEGETDAEARVALAARTLATLPDSNLFTRMTDFAPDTDFSVDPGALADMFLHPCERSYTVPEVHEWLAAAGAVWRAWTDDRHAYLPRAWISDPVVLARLERLDAAQQHAAAEAAGCVLAKHSLYASREDSSHFAVRLESPEAASDLVPFLWTPRPRAEISNELREHGQTRFGGERAAMVVAASEHVIPIFDAMDGVKTVAEILDTVAGSTASPGSRLGAFERLRQIVELLSLTNELFVRHRDVALPPTPQALHRAAFAPSG